MAFLMAFTPRKPSELMALLKMHENIVTFALKFSQVFNGIWFHLDNYKPEDLLTKTHSQSSDNESDFLHSQ